MQNGDWSIWETYIVGMMYHLTGQSDSISRVVYIDFTEMEYVNIAFVPVVTVSTL